MKYSMVSVLALALLAPPLAVAQPVSALADRFQRLDRNGDGTLTRNEIPRLFDQLDADKDGAVTLKEAQAYRSGLRIAPRPIPAAAPGGLAWRKSLVFDAAEAGGAPLPVNTMNLAAHKGRLYAGMASAFEEGNYSRHSSYVFVKPSANEDWRLDADFGPGTERVGSLLAARFENGADGKPIPGGPVDLLVAATMKLRRAGPPQSLQVRIRDDAAECWQTVSLPTPALAESNVREMIVHRDRVTGADLLMVAASPEPLGIYSGAYDASSPDGMRWSDEPEVSAQGRRDGASKWFGMAVVNGFLLAANTRDIYRRVDGPQPRWVKVAEFGFAGDIGNTEIRGLTAVPNPAEATGWPEQEVLFFTSRMKLWRMRVPESSNAEHTRQVEFDMVPYLSERTRREVVFAEAAFNRLPVFRPSGKAEPVWPVGFQLVYGVPGKRPTQRDPSSYELTHEAFYFLRDQRGRYTLHTIVDPADPARRLFLARDFEPSPFPAEDHVLYAGGFNGSYFKGSFGTAWVYRGEFGAKDNEPAKGPSEAGGTSDHRVGQVNAFTELQFHRDFVPGGKDLRGNELSGTELNALAIHDGMLWAAMSYMPERGQRGSGDAAGPKILVKRSANAAWEVDYELGPRFIRAGFMKSVTFMTDGNGRKLEHPVPILLVGDWMRRERGTRDVETTQRSVGVWSRDDGSGRWTRHVLSTKQRAVPGGPENTEVRLLFDHVDGVTGVHHVFAGASQGELFRGAYDPAAPGLIIWEQRPELADRRHRFISATDANGDIYVTVPIDDTDSENGGLFKRVDGRQPRWERVGAWPLPDLIPARSTFACGLRGLTTANAPDGTHGVLIGAAEDYHTIWRFDPADGYRPERELDVRDHFTRLWGDAPRRPVIVAYNDMTPAKDPATGKPCHLLGLWVTHPDGEGSELGNSSWYLVRSAGGAYTHGRIFDPTHPRTGAPYGLRGCRSILPSPFPEERDRVWYFAGFDQTGQAWGNHAWIYKGTLSKRMERP